MTSERYKEIMTNLGMPNSRSLYVALQQVANETAQSIRKELESKLAQARNMIERLKQEAKFHAQEARTARATVHECYQAVGAQKGDWNGAQPVREFVAQAREELKKTRRAIKFPRETKPDNILGGWTISFDYLMRIEKELQNTNEDPVDLETIESVLLSVELAASNTEKDGE